MILKFGELCLKINSVLLNKEINCIILFVSIHYLFPIWEFDVFVLQASNQFFHMS